MSKLNRAETSGFTQHHKNGAGFTLIELLVVISIISLLASIVLASLNSARAKARNARRISDFKQVQTALAFYSEFDFTKRRIA